jgi:hypothetical protein
MMPEATKNWRRAPASNGTVVFIRDCPFNRRMFPEENPFTARLDPGEKLLWSGQPKQGVRLQPQDVFLIPFSLMWGGFAIFWEATVLGIVHLAPAHAVRQNPPLFFSLWGIPFVVVGLYLIFGRFFYDAALRKKTFYAVTDRRLIVLKNLFGFNLASFDLGSSSNLNINERSDGSGDILFGSPSSLTSLTGSGWPNSRRYAVPGFYLLPNARAIFNMIRDAQNAARKA